ncbi:MAG: dienelactone hydrolase family protein [Thaumarchaeota archaeon]|nr:dienelactone hydrolase family protein [Nitrososphaerota archaeon]
MGESEKSEGKRSRRNFIVAGQQAPAPQPAPVPAPAPQQPAPAPKPAIPDKFTDDQLATGPVKFSGEVGEISAYQARPQFDAKFPAMIIIHENAGLLDHFRDLARRYAREGYVAVAIDFLSRVGGTGQDDRDNQIRQSRLKDTEIQSDIDSTIRYLKAQPYVKGDKIGITGFCWGGRQSLIATLRSKELAAGVPFYGFPINARPSETASINPIDLVPASTTPILAHFGGNDRAIPQDQVDRFEQALKENKKDFESYTYPNAGHAFFNDSRPQVYNAEAAKLAWERTLAFLAKKLKS